MDLSERTKVDHVKLHPGNFLSAKMQDLDVDKTHAETGHATLNLNLLSNKEMQDLAHQFVYY